MTTGIGGSGSAAGEPAAGAGNPAGAAAQPSQTGTHQGGGNDAELDRLRRIEQQYKGSQPLIDAMVKAGIRTAEDLTRIHGVASRVGELGIDLEQLSTAVRGKAKPNAGDAGGGEDDGEDLDAKLDKKLAKRDHESAEQAERRLVAGVVNALAGEGATDKAKKAVRGIVAGLVEEQSKLYPKGHPMAGELKPLTEAEIAAIRTEAEGIWRDVRGASLASVAAGAATARPAAGAQGGQGPSGQDKGNQKQLPPHLRSRDERLAQARQIRNGITTARGMAPMSQV